jgi:hypothetical protein
MESQKVKNIVVHWLGYAKLANKVVSPSTFIATFMTDIWYGIIVFLS